MTEEDARTPGRSFVSIAGSILNVTSPWVINNNISILSVHETKNGAIFIVDRMINVSENNFSNNNVSNLSCIRVYKSIKIIDIECGLLSRVSQTIVATKWRIYKDKISSPQDILCKS